MPLRRADRLPQHLLIAVVGGDVGVVQPDEQRRHVFGAHVLGREGDRLVGAAAQAQQHELPAGMGQHRVQHPARQRIDVELVVPRVHPG